MYANSNDLEKYALLHVLVLFCYSPRSGTSSNASTPSAKKMEEKPTTPISKSVTPTSGGSGSSVAGSSALKPLVKTPSLGRYSPGTAAVPSSRNHRTNDDMFPAAAQYPHYLGAGHDLQAAATAYGSLHNNLPPAMGAYPRPPLVSYGNCFTFFFNWCS